jgi:hypothetical protein
VPGGGGRGGGSGRAPAAPVSAAPGQPLPGQGRPAGSSRRGRARQRAGATDKAPPQRRHQHPVRAPGGMTPYDCPSQNGILPSVSMTMCIVSPVALGPTMRSTDLTRAWERGEGGGGWRAKGGGRAARPGAGGAPFRLHHALSRRQVRRVGGRAGPDGAPIAPTTALLAPLPPDLERRLVGERVHRHLALLQLQRHLGAGGLVGKGEEGGWAPSAAAWRGRPTPTSFPPRSRPPPQSAGAR